ncbi:PD40 domain-containing protein [candidate division KSB1 bacterium]|nr:PD40 domain-containing protein [candidate division KSB1 bacterium]
MKRNPVANLFFILTLFLIASCGGLQPTLTLESMDRDYELLVVENKTDLCKLNSRSGEIEKIMAMGRPILSPVWSPDGQSIAMFLMKDKDFDPFKSDDTAADLVVLKVGGFEPQYSGKFEFVQEIDRNGWKFTSITTPVWHPDSKKIFVHDKSGLKIVVLGDKTVSLIHNSAIHKLDIALSKANVIYSIEKDLFAYNFKTRKSVEIAALSPTLRLLLKKKIEAIRFSPDENFLAVAVGNKLILIDVKTLREHVIHNAQNTIYDLVWNPDGTQIAALSGKYASYASMGIGAAPGGKIPGQFNVTCVGIDGKKQHKIFENKSFNDVRETSIAYSPDGKWLSFLSTTLNDKRRKICIASTIGQGWTVLKSGEDYSAHDWRPLSGR